MHVVERNTAKILIHRHVLLSLICG